MDFLNRLLNRPSPKPAICDDSPTRYESASEQQIQQQQRQQLPPSAPNADRRKSPDLRLHHQQQHSSDHLIRELSEASSAPSSLVPESLSSASSFQSLASTLSSKSSSGICVDSAPGSPDKGYDHSYVSVDIPELDDLISSCANIDLNAAANATVSAASQTALTNSDDSADLSQDQTFASAADDSIVDETQINVSVIENTSIQTFKTCPTLETTQILNFGSSTNEVFKRPHPVEKTSVIPYVSFEESVLKKYQSETDNFSTEFSSALNLSQSAEASSTVDCSPISSNGFVVKSPATDLDSEKEDLNSQSTIQVQKSVEQQCEIEDDFEDIQTLNSTIVLNSEPTLETISIDEVPEKVNSINSNSIEKDSLLSLSADDFSIENEINCISANTLNKEEKFLLEETKTLVNNKEILAQAETEDLKENQIIAQESKTLNKNEVALHDTKVLNESEVIEQETNILDKTKDIIHFESSLNKTEVIVQESKILYEAQDNIQFNNVSGGIESEALNFNTFNTINKTEDIINLENSLNQTKNIIPETNILNITQNIQEENNLNKIGLLAQAAKTPDTSEVELKTTNILNNTELIIQNVAENFSKIDILLETKEENIKSIETQHLKSNTVEEASNKQEIVKEEQCCAPIKEIKNSIDNQLIKTPSKLDLTENINHSEAHVIEESRDSNLLNSGVIASTPLPVKNLNKENALITVRSKSALFDHEPDSPNSKSPQIFIPSVNTFIKSEPVNQEENTIKFNETVVKNKTSLEFNTLDRLINETDLETTANVLHENSLNIVPPPEPEYEAFQPQQQSTTLPFPDDCQLQALHEAALSVAKDIDASLEKIEENEQFVSATAELFEDPSAFDYLTQVGSQTSKRGERYDSLYMKFDPLAQRLSMLPQKNLPISPSLEEEEEKEIKTETPISNLGTPRKNPALAAIDRLLFYSPCQPTSTDNEVAEAKQKKEEVEKPQPVTPVVDEKMAKELELVRSTVLELEAELEKQKQEHKEQLERQKTTSEEKISHIQTKVSQMQTQLMQEIKCKDQMTVVVEEYEKSISRLIAEREKDRTNFETEKAKLQEELQVANQHLSNTEAAFSDVHSKYERLKNVVSAYKSNEAVLKESIAENQETIKTLENRYEQLKSHAMAQLEKANLELSAIKKHNDAETIKLKALVRKAELKSKSLEETVEQKMKENKELAQIIDEMIARVD